MEVGSLNTKIGFAGKDRPDVVAPSVHLFPYLFSMCKLIKLTGKRLSLTSFRALLKRAAIHRVYWKIVSLTIGRDFRY